MLRALLDVLFGVPYDPLDLDTRPPKSRPFYDLTSTPERRSDMAHALRGLPIDRPHLDPSRMIPGRERR